LKLVLDGTFKLYVKVVHAISSEPIVAQVSVTYMPEEVETFIAKLMHEESSRQEHAK